MENSFSDNPLLIQNRERPESFLKRNIQNITAVFIILLITGGIVYLVSFKPEAEKTQRPYSSRDKTSPDSIIARAGEENIYRKDLDIEMLYYPSKAKTDRKKLLLEKIVKDSIILQGAKEDSLISLDGSVFNSAKKDYLKRVELVEQAKKKIEDQGDLAEGTVISIWFNNVKPGIAGYEKGKEIAFSKITKLHSDVKSGKITVKKAGELIQKDTSLAQVDKSYKSNAVFDFKVNKNQNITFDSKFNSILLGLKTGAISDIYLIQDKEYKSDKKIDSVYMFGTVYKRLSPGKTSDFDSWFSKKEKLYEVKYY